MAAPTYFPRQPVRNKENNTADMFIDGGVFANNPELTALWTIRMRSKQLDNYHLLSIGTCCP
ncbi:unnamed protein product, partial [Didymodactylos carnosus]